MTAATQQQIDAELDKLEALKAHEADLDVVRTQVNVLRQRMTAGQVHTFYGSVVLDDMYEAALQASYWLTGAMGPGTPPPSARWA